MHQAPLVVAGIVFAVIAIVHIVRCFHYFPVVVGGFEIPLSISIGGAVVFGLLTIWMFASAFCRTCS